MHQVTHKNYHVGTVANFTACEMPSGKPDYVSASGSKYYYTETGIIRVADHWGDQIASCSWNIDVEYIFPYKKEVTRGEHTYMGSFVKCIEVAGYCDLKNFKFKKP